MHHRLIALTFLAGASMSAHATAVSDFNNFTVGNTETQSGTTFGGNQALAVAFYAQATGGLTNLLLAAGAFRGADDGLVISLAGNSATNTPGTVLESFTVPGPSLGSDSPTGVPALSLDSVLHPLLTANTFYWITAQSANPNGSTREFIWNTNVSGNDNSTAFTEFSNTYGATWTAEGAVRGAFSVTADTSLGASPVPLPASAWLLLSGLLGLVALNRRSLSVG